MADLSGEEQLDIKAALDEIRNVAQKGTEGTTKEERAQKMDEIRDLPGLSGRQAGQSQTFSDNQTNRLRTGEGTDTASDNATQYRSNQGGGADEAKPQKKEGGESQEGPNEQQGQLDAARRKKKEAAKKGKDDQKDKLAKYYPKPIRIFTWLSVGALAVAVDGLTLILTITGVGEIFGWVVGALFVVIYYVIIYYQSPKEPGFRQKINFRGIANFVIESIPYLGSVWVGNSLVVFISFIMIRRWEKGQPTGLPGVGEGASKKAGAAMSSSPVGGEGGASAKPAAPTPSASG